MATIDLRGISIAYDDIGQGVPVLFVHGHPFNRSMWSDQSDALKAHYRVIAPDLRGYGQSTVVPGVTLLSDMANDLTALLDALGIDRIVLCGLSMGGQIVLEFYRLFPERVRALILADTFAQGETADGKQARNVMADRLLKEGMGGYAAETLSKMVSAATIEQQPEVAARVMTMMQTTPPEGAAAALRGRAERPDYVDLLSRIAVPTLIVVGSDDAFTPVSDAQFMHDRIPQSQLVVIQGAGHMPNMEKTAEFNSVLIDFLALA